MAVTSILSRSALRALPLIEGAVRAGLSSNAIEKLVRRQIGPISRQNLQQAVRYVASVQDMGRAYKRLSKSRIIDEAMHTEAKTVLRRNYSYRINASIIFSTDGPEFDHYITISSNKRLTPLEIEATSESLILLNDEYDVLEIKNIGVEAMLRVGERGKL